MICNFKKLVKKACSEVVLSSSKNNKTCYKNNVNLLLLKFICMISVNVLIMNLSIFWWGFFCRCSMLLDICSWNAYNKPYWEFEIKYQNYLSETSLIQLRWFHFYLLFIFLPSISQNNNIWCNKKSLPFAI